MAVVLLGYLLVVSYSTSYGSGWVLRAALSHDHALLFLGRIEPNTLAFWGESKYVFDVFADVLKKCLILFNFILDCTTVSNHRG